MSLFPGWSTADVGELSGRHAVVTGSTSGVGLAVARALAAAGASVVVPGRDPDRVRAAVARIQAGRYATVQPASLDLADLASVRRFADAHLDRPLDLLVNNAGVMAVPRRRTVDGFELHLATNHLGHFALTGLLLPALGRAVSPRVVTVSSIAHWMGSLDFADLMGDRAYDPWSAYCNSKLANLLFMRELGRRAAEAGLGLVSAGAHPGIANTNLATVAPRMTGHLVTAAALKAGSAVVGQPARTAALPVLRAAVDPGVRSGDYVGPRGPMEAFGRPKRVRMSANAQDDVAARLLWEASEHLTRVTPALVATTTTHDR